MSQFDLRVSTFPGEEPYRYFATSPRGFVWQLAVSYITWGYRFWVGGLLPEDSDPRFHDSKMLFRYGVEVTKAQRSYRRRAKKEAGVQYLRWQRHWILIAQKGKSVFFTFEPEFRDIRTRSYFFCGYSIKWQGDDDGKVHVAIAERVYNELARGVKEQALRRSPGEWKRWFWELPYEPYEPVQKQAEDLLELINERRKKAGETPLGLGLIRRRMKPVLPFD